MSQFDNTTPKLGWSSANFMFSFGTLPIVGITSVSWSHKQDIQAIYGSGSEPIGYGIGKSEYEASITLQLEEVLTLIQAAPSGKLTKVRPFDLIILFKAEGSTKVQTLKLVNCMFKENKAAIKQGDLSVEQEIPLFCSDVILL